MKNHITVIEHFITEKQCNDIKAVLNKKIWNAKDPFIKTGFSIDESSAVDYYYHDSTDLNLTFNRIGRRISYHYNSLVELKSMFHSIMTPGALNPLHWDNYVDNGADDISALLYLNEGFKGGDLYFPDQDIRITPKAGMLVFFMGTEEYHHTVEVVQEGNREALVGFYWPVETRKRVMA